MKRNKLTKGISFRPVWCLDAPSEPEKQKDRKTEEEVEKGTAKENKLVKQNVKHKSNRKSMNKFIEKEFDGWMAQVEKTAPDPQDYIAFNIGLFETEGGFAMYLYASDEYDEEDSDWPCGDLTTRIHSTSSSNTRTSRPKTGRNSSTTPWRWRKPTWSVTPTTPSSATK